MSRLLGRGGMGEVWLAQDERLGAPLALKLLPPEVRADPIALDDLRRETARSQKLTHPNIVRIHDLHEDSGGMAFIAMEYVDGPTLAGLRLQQPERVLNWQFLRPLVQQLCAALDYAHGEKVIHRDLKPANVMVDGKGRLKLADFGIAATVSDSVSRVSGRHNTSGTLPYMSPQQLAGKHPQVADDIYALGATLYELLTSKPPFYTGDITHQVLHEEPEPPDERLAALGIQNDVPPDVAAIVMACLAKEPAQRPQSARAVAEWVGLEVVSKPSLQSLTSEVFREAESGEAAGPSEVGDATPPPPGSRRRFLLAGVAAAVLVLVALGGWYRGIHSRAKRNRLVPEQTVASETTTATAAVNVATTSAGVTSGNEAVSKAESWEQWHERTSGSATHDIPAPTALTPAALEKDFRPLFNGKDITGWKRRNPNGPNSWSVLPDGILKNTFKKGVQGTDLLTEQKFWNFTVRVEFMTPENSNTGLYLRGRHEIQILGDYKEGKASPLCTGSIYKFKAPDRFVTKPSGEWQTVEVTIIGNRITVILNGVKIHDDVECNRATGGELDGQVNEPGPILLQGDHGTASFRNLRIRELP